MDTRRHFAEIIESSLHVWRAQCWKWNEVPSYGSLMAVNSVGRTIFGIVYAIQTGSSDPSRLPYAYQKTEEELMHEQPQIFEFLQTTFSCLTLGYQEHDKHYYQLSPEPPKIHAFVCYATKEQLLAFFKKEMYLHLLFSNSAINNSVDELLLALLKRLSDHKLLEKEDFSRFIQTFSLLTGNDYRRLKLFLQRVEHCIQIA